MRRVLNHFSIAFMGLALLATQGCKEEEARRSPTQITSRAKAVQEAERKRLEAQQTAQTSTQEGSSKGPPSNAGTGGAAGSAGNAPPTPQYMSPSERGADVQVTERRLDGNATLPSAARTATPAAPAAAGRPRAQGGGNMPSLARPADASVQPNSVPGEPSGGTGLPASPRGGASVLSTEGATAAAVSASERGGALNQELQRKLGEFDARMRKAQENAAKERAQMGGAAAAERGAVDGRGGRLVPPEVRGAGGAAGTATGLGSTPDKSGATQSADRRYPRNGTSGEVPAGGDDDIVARQLREAADREPDPVLREKLRAEYRKYKGGL
ncbi:MAG: hypothetical protein HYX63_07110 [Gammaproteobacteria bacterium]|nr:hypothetical protein [Gammaproteobacteria bacterium]